MISLLYDTNNINKWIPYITLINHKNGMISLRYGTNNIYHSKFDPFTFYLGKKKKINFLLCLKTKEKINKFKEKNQFRLKPTPYFPSFFFFFFSLGYN